MNRTVKYLLSVSANIIPFVLNYLLLYRVGVIGTLVSVPMWQILCFINFMAASGRKSFSVLCVITTFCAGYTELTATRLYYDRISSDTLSLYVGFLLAAYTVLAVLILWSALLFVKRAKKSDTSDIKTDSLTMFKNKCTSPPSLPWAIVLSAIILGFAMFIVGSLLCNVIYFFTIIQYLGVPLMVAGVANLIPIFAVYLWFSD